MHQTPPGTGPELGDRDRDPHQENLDRLDLIAARHQVRATLTDLATGDLDADTIAARAEAIRERLTRQLATAVANARADEREQLGRDLAGALGIPPEKADGFGWATLRVMVVGVRTIADLVLGIAELGPLGPAGQERRRELLNAFGVAEEWARAVYAAEANAPELRDMLGLPDPVARAATFRKDGARSGD